MLYVAAYCRVSTDQEDQKHSFESQKRYFETYIQKQDDWKLYRIYADEGVTGTSTQKRTAFHQMIQAAEAGCFQMILTKEVSRFSRNNLDTLTYTRKLNAWGVRVRFMNDGIDTGDPDAELRLSIMGSLAQEESRRTSDRVKWGQTRRMEQGIVFGRSLLGYTVKHGHLTVNETEAKLVHLIFHKYGVEKKGTTIIARELEAAGFRTARGNEHWSESHLVKILKNEKYVGDLVQKKTVTPDYLSHKKENNHGQEPMIVLRDHHEPIIDRALWDLVQRELSERKRIHQKKTAAGPSRRYLFSGKIRCGVCGSCFVSREKTRKNGSKYRRWSCGTSCKSKDRKDKYFTVCPIGRTLRDELALDMLCQALQSLPLDWETLIQCTWELVHEAIQTEAQADRGSSDTWEKRQKKLQDKRALALDAFLSQTITETELRQMTDRYDQELRCLDQQKPRPQGQDHLSEEKLRSIVADSISGAETCEGVYRQLLDHIVLFSDGRAELSLCGVSQPWIFQLEPAKAQNNASVPISVSRPWICG